MCNHLCNTFLMSAAIWHLVQLQATFVAKHSKEVFHLLDVLQVAVVDTFATPKMQRWLPWRSRRSICFNTWMWPNNRMWSCTSTIAHDWASDECDPFLQLFFTTRVSIAGGW